MNKQNYRYYKLGRRPPSNKPAIQFRTIWTGAVPEHPAAVDHFAKVSDWGLYGNDKYGVCGPVSIANQRKLVTKYLGGEGVSATQDDVFDLYRRSGNPNFDPLTHADDNGVDMQTMLEQVVKGGIGMGSGLNPPAKAIAFARVNVKNPDELRAAVAIFGSMVLGVLLEDAQDAQTHTGLWDYAESPLWGGHAILHGRYRDEPGDINDRDGVITWGKIVDMTQAFIAHQLEEAWIVIWPENLGTIQFQQGIDLRALAVAYLALTDRVLPIAPPAPPPVPDNPGCLNPRGMLRRGF